MNPTPFRPRLLALAGLCLGLVLGTGAAVAQEATIRKAIAERLPDFPKIDEISKSPIPGLYEVRIGSNIFYATRRVIT